MSDWSAYNEAQRGRPLRPLFQRLLEAAGPGEGRQAVEIGCGAGVEVLGLLRAGWRVHAFDGEPSTVERVLATTGTGWGEQLVVEVRDFAEPPALPPAQLVYSGAALPFATPEQFEVIWGAVRAALVPGGWLAVDLFGDRDTWAGELNGTFVSESTARDLLAGLEVHGFDVEDKDGPSFSGPKHWHVFRVIARRP